ncbi:MAG: tetrameric acyl-CoA thioesterase [Microbacteriaceae bacterium]|nr:tetrameric acyl-CoA thioesterase [Microbacteriaceae bacterium]
MLNAWPPFVGAGIRVMEASADFLFVRVRLRQYPLNTNAFGTHFGGSIYAMTDPFYAIMLAHHMGAEYAVWDKAAEVDYVAPGRGDVFAEFRLDPPTIDEIRREVADGQKHLRWFTVPVVASDGTTVAVVRRQLYIRRRRAAVA